MTEPTPDPDCENCDGRGCMGCIFREYDHDCKDDCPMCCPAVVQHEDDDDSEWELAYSFFVWKWQFIDRHHIWVTPTSVDGQNTYGFQHLSQVVPNKVVTLHHRRDGFLSVKAAKEAAEQYVVGLLAERRAKRSP